MKTIVLRKRLIFFLLMIILGIFLKLCIGYGMYIDDCFIGVVRTPSEGAEMLEILSADKSISLYPRLILSRGYTSASDILENAKKTRGAETEAPAPTVTPSPTEIVPAELESAFLFPLSEISVSSPFGARDGRTHEGIDLAAEEGTPILAADSGIVTFSGVCEGYGNLIILDHQNGFTTYYAHCSTLHAPLGARPEKGERIAEVGSTGRSTGPHLHFEIRKKGTPQDPRDFFPNLSIEQQNGS